MPKTNKKKEVKVDPGEKFRQGELQEMILGALGIGVLIGGTLITPNFPIVYGSILSIIKEFSKKEPSKKQVRRVLKNLEKNEIIALEKKGDEVYVSLKGWINPRHVKYSLKGILAYKRQKKIWRGKWFLVIFDVPEKQRNKRNYLRNFLNFIGFYPYQQSVYIFPYECKEEIALVKKIVEGGKYISYIIADAIENEENIKRHFQIQ